MTNPWFDPESNLLLLDDYVASRPSFQKIMADDVVTDAELEEQSARTIQLLKRLESLLPPAAKETATEALCELAVLFVLQQRRHMES